MKKKRRKEKEEEEEGGKGYEHLADQLMREMPPHVARDQLRNEQQNTRKTFIYKYWIKKYHRMNRMNSRVNIIEGFSGLRWGGGEELRWRKEEERKQLTCSSLLHRMKKHWQECKKWSEWKGSIDEWTANYSMSNGFSLWLSTYWSFLCSGQTANPQDSVDGNNKICSCGDPWIVCILSVCIDDSLLTIGPFHWCNLKISRSWREIKIKSSMSSISSFYGSYHCFYQTLSSVMY